MTNDRSQRLRAVLRTHGGHGAPPLVRICTTAVSELGVSGAGVTLVTSRSGGVDTQMLARASDTVIARLDDLQLTVGEGPGLTALATGAPVLVADLAATGSRWPVFAYGAMAIGVAAVFCFPLRLGTIRLGSLDCYRRTTGGLNTSQVADALLLADLAIEVILAEIEGHEPDDLGWISDLHAEVHQASGMVTIQLGTDMRTALLRIRAHAYVHDLPLATVARQIVDRQLSLAPE